MSDDELNVALTTLREDYVPEALLIIASELERRSVNPRERVPADAGPKPVILRWLTAYVALSGISSFGIVIALLAGGWNEGWLWQLVLSTATIVISFHLNQRMRWAWWANAFLLGYLTLRGLSNPTLAEAWVGALWGIGNGLYFFRERRHFNVER